MLFQLPCRENKAFAKYILCNVNSALYSIWTLRAGKIKEVEFFGEICCYFLLANCCNLKCKLRNDMQKQVCELDYFFGRAPSKWRTIHSYNKVRWAQFATFSPWTEEITKFVHPSFVTQNPIAAKMILGWWIQYFLQLLFLGKSGYLKKDIVAKLHSVICGWLLWKLSAKSFRVTMHCLCTVTFFKDSKKVFFWEKNVKS